MNGLKIMAQMERAYVDLMVLIPMDRLKTDGALKYKNGPYMDLNVDYLGTGKDGVIRIAMAHNYISNGDVMADPDMEIGIHPASGMAEALTYQQDALGVFHRVYVEGPNGGQLVNMAAKRELQAFLATWISNLKAQGFTKDKIVAPDAEV